MAEVKSDAQGQWGAKAAIRVFAPFIRPHGRALALSVLLVVAATGVALLRPWPLAYLFDEVLIPDQDSASAQTKLIVIGLAIAGIALLEAGLSYLRTNLLTATGQRVAFSIRTGLYKKMQQLSLAFHERQHTGELITRVTKDVDKVQGLITDNLIEAGSGALTLVGMFVVMFILDWQLTLAMLVLLPLLLITIARFRRRIKANESKVRNNEGEITSLTQETLSSIRVVKAFGRENYETDRFHHQNAQALDATLRAVRMESLFTASMSVLTAVATAFVVWFGAQRVLTGSLSPGDLLVFVAYLRDFYNPLRSLSKLSAQMSKASVRAERIAEVLDEVPAVKDLPGARPAPQLRGDIRFEKVSFGYQNGVPVLHDVSFTARAGEVIALVGATGAGKSTAAGLVLRLYDPTSGRILIDDVDARDYTLESLQAQIGVVLQSSLLFYATVRENIAYGRPDAAFEDVLAAAQVAGADEFIRKLPEGYETIVGERGDTLSGGQRQRVAIARAVVRGSPILLLDEPTTGLDANAEAYVLDALDQVMTGRTTLVIAHKLSTVRRAHQILVVDSGRIVERGTHEELLELDGRYAQMCLLQGVDMASFPMPMARTAGGRHL